MTPSRLLMPPPYRHALEVQGRSRPNTPITSRVLVISWVGVLNKLCLFVSRADFLRRLLLGFVLRKRFYLGKMVPAFLGICCLAVSRTKVLATGSKRFFEEEATFENDFSDSLQVPNKFESDRLFCCLLKALRCSHKKRREQYRLSNMLI